LQAADSMKIAANNPGGLAGAGAGIGAGMAMGQAMSNAFNAPQQNSGSNAAPPPPPSGAANVPRWSLAIDGKTYGPYTDDALKAMVQGGQVTSATQAWRPGAGGWAPLDTYSELGLGGGSTMPPPPPKE
jgi:hypothetical protein